MKPNTARELIYLIARHSNWQPEQLEQTLRSKNVYASRTDWVRFIEIFLAGTGAAFLVAGIIFFFAFNWADIPKFGKFALIEGLLLAIMAVYFFTNLKQPFKNILLTAAAMLVGVLFAVYGQIYQTGANAFDFFLGWTYCIALWVVVSKYHPLWLIFLVLINTTFWFYSQQVAAHWPASLVYCCLFLFNALVVVVWEMLVARNKIQEPPYWFAKAFTLAATCFATVNVIWQIWGDRNIDSGIFVLLIFAIYSLGLWFSVRHKRLFYLAVLPFSLLIMLAAFLLKVSNDSTMILFIGLLVIGLVTLQIKVMLTLKKQWYGLTE